ncbi:MAG: mechanosensitive ion channel family protein [bacterium]|nr:mechanosensitive ion channel family protein [bacterium]
MEVIKTVLYVISASLVGILIEKIVISRLISFVESKQLKTGYVVIKALKGFVILWFILLGLYFGIINLSIENRNIDFLIKFVFVLFGLSFTFFLSNLIAGFISNYIEKFKDTLPSASILINVVKISIVVIGLLVILNTIGISISPILAGLGIGGLAIALAMQDTLTNLFSGIHILASKHIKPGDYIKLETNIEGYVLDITWRNTTLRDLSNNLIVIPNSKLAQSIVKNVNIPTKAIIVPIEVAVSYESDLEKVENVTVGLAKELLSDFGILDFEPFLRFHTLGDYAINFTVFLKSRDYTEQFLLKHEFIKRLLKKYNEEGISIPYPIRTIYYKEM